MDELRKKHEKGGKVNMCKGLRDLLADERSEGKAERPSLRQPMSWKRQRKTYQVCILW